MHSRPHRSFKSLLLAILAGSFLAPGATALAKTIRVLPTADLADGSGKPQHDPRATYASSLQEAVDLAEHGDVIQLSAGVYAPGETTFIERKSLVIRGVLDPATGEPATVISGRNTREDPDFSGIVFHTENRQMNDFSFLEAVVRFEHLEITEANHGISTSWYCEVFGCVFRGNHNQDFIGAALTTYGGAFMVDQCRFEHNSSRRGGAISIHSTSNHVSNHVNDSVIANSTFIGNHAMAGGAISWGACDVMVIDCVFEGNSAEVCGGAVVCDSMFDAPSGLTGCRFSGNQAPQGAGLAFFKKYWGEWQFADLQFCANDGGNVQDLDLAPGSSSSYDLFDDSNTFAHSCVDPRDLNNDGVIDGHDLGLFFGLYNTSNPNADFDGDGEVSSGDLGLFFAGWGSLE